MGSFSVEIDRLRHSWIAGDFVERTESCFALIPGVVEGAAALRGVSAEFCKREDTGVSGQGICFLVELEHGK